MVVPKGTSNAALPAWPSISLVDGDLTESHQAALCVRPGAIVPVGKIVQSTTEESLSPLTLVVSFDSSDNAYRALKTVLEGGIAGRPRTVIFYATSNRRHLMPREHASDDAIAAAEDAEETVSVSDRFGLWIGFPPMDQPTYLAAIRGYAAIVGLNTDELERQALQWSIQRGARSGRVAMQFIRDRAGEHGIPLPF
jgi:predicted AAA+ superfamily ATPase